MMKRAIAASAIAISAIAGYEGLSLVAYKDPVGIPTICYGYTKDVFMGMTKTVQECQYLLESEVEKFSKGVLDLYSGPITQGELDAYTSLSYNIGLDAFSRSTLLKKLKSGDRKGACNELRRWVYAGGKVLRGLEARRKAEERMCLSGLN